MFHRILVPLDGSERAEQALPVAGHLARASQGILLLVRVVPPTTMFVMYPETATAVQRATEAEIEAAQTYLEHVADLQSITGLHVETEVIEDQAAAGILTMAEERQVDLIVLCSHGYTGLKRWMLGSVAEKIVRHAPVPTLLLRENGLRLVDTSSHIDGSVHALIPLDGSQRAEEAIIPAGQVMGELVSPGAGSLHLTLAAVLPLHKQSTQEHEQLAYQTAQYLNDLATRTSGELAAQLPRELKISITCLVTSDEDIAEGILRLAEESQDTEEPGTKSAELIAMTTHGYSGLQRWPLGSIIERIVHSTKLPMLIVRPADMLSEKEELAESKDLTVI